MRKKILFTSHTANFAKFNVPFMRALKQQGHEIHYASAGEEPVPECDRHFTVPFERSPLKPANYQAYKQLKKIIDEQNYDLIHTHTPMGSVVTRLAARTARTRGTKIIYTAHGFHFFKGAPLLNWLIYYPIEKTLARHADALVTINQEDFNRARNKFKTNVYYLPGIGVDLKKFQPTDSAKREALRKQYGYSTEDFILICIAELNANKNQAFLINHIYPLLLEIPTIKLLLCGTGDTAKQYEQLVTELNMHEQIQFLGYRNDVHNLLALSDVAVSSSKREGLGINLIEAMAVGLPLVALYNRGHGDIITQGKNGYLFRSGQEFIRTIIKLHSKPELWRKISKNNIKAVPKYDTYQALKSMHVIYKRLL